MDESRILRDRQGSIEAAIDGVPRGRPACADARLVQTTQLSDYPTTAAAYYACYPCAISGIPGEGNAASYVPDTSTILFCWNAGSQVPPEGTTALAHGVGGRLVIEYDG